MRHEARRHRLTDRWKCSAKTTKCLQKDKLRNVSRVSSFTSWSFRRSPGCFAEQRRRTSRRGRRVKNLPQFRLLQSRLGPTQEAAGLFGSPPPPPAHTQPNTGEEKGKIRTLPRLFRCRERGRNAAVYPQLCPAPSSCGAAGLAEAEDKFIRSGGPAELRPVPAPAAVLHFTFVGSFPFGYPPPWLVSDQTITFQRVLNNEKKVGFPFFLGRRRTHPSG